MRTIVESTRIKVTAFPKPFIENCHRTMDIKTNWKEELLLTSFISIIRHIMNNWPIIFKFRLLLWIKKWNTHNQKIYSLCSSRRYYKEDIIISSSRRNNTVIIITYQENIIVQKKYFRSARFLVIITLRSSKKLPHWPN